MGRFYRDYSFNPEGELFGRFRNIIVAIGAAITSLPAKFFARAI